MGTCYGFVSTYPPTQCGLATFTAALRDALTASGVDEGRVVRLMEEAGTRTAPGVAAELVQGDPASARRALAQLNDCDVVVLQHEFGVFGGLDGADVLPLLGALRVPCVVVLHTVLVTPTVHQRAVLESLVAQADAVVTMTATARERLVAGYAVDPAKIRIIPHGAPEVLGSTTRMTSGSTSPTVLTWGLLGPGKGIEWGIEAMALLDDLRPRPRYVVAGQTHPKVLLHEGEAYRGRLTDLVRRRALGTAVSFDGRYRDMPALSELVASADVVLLPYDSTEQVTSGVLIEAVAAGKPVVATAFPHAVELLAAGAGLVVAHRDAGAIADALRTVLTRTDLAARMTAAAAVSAPRLRWSAVAERYRELTARLITARLAA